ncbi:transporter substrate-binding domain-containing protein [Pseudomonas marginalis]|uniref:transporter substrate-binding domain-containing protein n=1 Tax=Pseudomonas marginalis TaxID=298 RepID=UPI0038B589A5
MRFSPGLLLLLSLLSPLAHAELIDDVNDRGELRIALEANTPPYNFKEGDKLTGFEVELGELLAKEMDVRPSFITTDDADMLPGVSTGKYDVAINHVAMTAELKDQFDFSEAYHDKPELAIPFQKGNPAFKTSLDGALKRVKDDGRLKALSQKWFEDQAPADAPTPEPTQATPAH